MNSKTTKSQSPSSPEPMTVNGNTTTDLFTIANGFCTYFTNVVEQLLSNMPSPAQSHQRVDAVLKRANGNSFSLKPVTVNFVNRQLRLLKSTKATGLDGISARLLKDAAPSISAPLTVIINLSITTAVVPEDWKHARVVPLHKGGDNKSMDNYRPISVLPVASKILEKEKGNELLQKPVVYTA